MLTARTEAEPYVEAAGALRDGRYACRLCGAPVTLKTGRVRASHFAHRPDAACAFGAPMSPAHLAAQERIAAALRGRGLAVELEARIAGDGQQRRIDVLTWPPDRPQSRVAIEVQASDLTADTLATRTASYAAMDVAPLWLRLLDFGAFPAVQTLPFRGTVWIGRYHAKAWERWAHDHLGGRLWFMDAGTGHVWRGLFVDAHRRRDRARLTKVEGGAEDGGRAADWTRAKQWVDLELDGPFNLVALKLRRGVVSAPDGVRRRLAWFVPPGETEAEPPFAAEVRIVFEREANGASRHPQVRIQGEWIPATTDGAASDWRTRRAETRPVLGRTPGSSPD